MNMAFSSLRPASAAQNDFEKRFTALQERFKACGHRLTKTTEPDGAIALFAGLGVYSRELDGLDGAERFLQQIGGAA